MADTMDLMAQALHTHDQKLTLIDRAVNIANPLPPNGESLSLDEKNHE